jgi:hypothetical protein
MGFDPVTLTIGTAVLSGLSSIAGSVAQKRQLQYQAQVAQNNARIANMNADYAARAGQQKEQSEAWKVRGLMGRQLAAQSANGLDVSSGSAQDVRASTAALGNLGIAAVRDNGMREYYGYKGQATNFMNDATLAKASEPTFLSTMLSAAQAAGGQLRSLPGTGSPAEAAAVPSPGEALAPHEDFQNPTNWVIY